MWVVGGYTAYGRAMQDDGAQVNDRHTVARCWDTGDNAAGDRFPLEVDSVEALGRAAALQIARRDW